MTAELFLTTDWSFDKLAPFGKDITAAMVKLAARFPKDTTVESLAEDVMSGRCQLWLVLDEGKFVLMGLTEIKLNPATGNKSVFIPSLGGVDGIATVPLIKGVEEYARSIGAHEVTICGRDGWKRPLAKQGYRARTALYRKDL